MMRTIVRTIARAIQLSIDVVSFVLRWAVYFVALIAIIYVTIVAEERYIGWKHHYKRQRERLEEINGGGDGTDSDSGSGGNGGNSSPSLEDLAHTFTKDPHKLPYGLCTVKRAGGAAHQDELKGATFDPCSKQSLVEFSLCDNVDWQRDMTDLSIDHALKEGLWAAKNCAPLLLGSEWPYYHKWRQGPYTAPHIRRCERATWLVNEVWLKRHRDALRETRQRYGPLVAVKSLATLVGRTLVYPKFNFDMCPDMLHPMWAEGAGARLMRGVTNCDGTAVLMAFLATEVLQGAVVSGTPFSHVLLSVPLPVNANRDSGAVQRGVERGDEDGDDTSGDGDVDGVERMPDPEPDAGTKQTTSFFGWSKSPRGGRAPKYAWRHHIHIDPMSNLCPFMRDPAAAYLVPVAESQGQIDLFDKVHQPRRLFTPTPGVERPTREHINYRDRPGAVSSERDVSKVRPFNETVCAKDYWWALRRRRPPLFRQQQILQLDANSPILHRYFYLRVKILLEEAREVGHRDEYDHANGHHERGEQKKMTPRPAGPGHRLRKAHERRKSHLATIEAEIDHFGKATEVTLQAMQREVLDRCVTFIAADKTPAEITEEWVCDAAAIWMHRQHEPAGCMA